MSWDLGQDHLDFQASCRAFVDNEVRPLVDEAESTGTFPAELWKKLGAAGLLGLTTPSEFGGSDGDALAVALLAEELSRACGGIAVTALVSAYMAAPHVLRYGTGAQRDRWVSRLVTGDAVAAIAVTEPDAGSDVAGVRTTARRSEGGGWVLDGRKMFITNAGLADLLIVGARTGPAGSGGLSLFLVGRDTPGLSLGQSLQKLGWHSSDTREVVLDHVSLPAEALLGRENRGFHQIMEGFQLERVALSGMGIGHAAECLGLARDYVRHRRAFGERLTALQTIRHRLADMEVRLAAARVMTYQAAGRMDAEHPEARPAVAQAKYLAAKVASEVVDDAVQLFGGAGFLEESPVVRHYRDVRVLRIGGGTDEIQLEILSRDLR